MIGYCKGTLFFHSFQDLYVLSVVNIVGKHFNFLQREALFQAYFGSAISP